MNIEIPGTEFYAGDAKRIAKAAADDRWDELRGGRITSYVALFPPERLGWTELVDLIVATATGSDVVPFRHDNTLIDIESDGLSVISAPDDWVSSLAAMTKKQLKNFSFSFQSAFNTIYSQTPEAKQIEATDRAFRTLVSICQYAESNQADVVEVYLADW